MGVSDKRDVLYVHREGGTLLDVDRLSEAIGGVSVSPIFPEDISTELDPERVACVVTDPSVRAGPLVSVLTAVRRVAPTLPVLCAVSESDIDVPETDTTAPNIERVVLEDDGVERLAQRIDARARTDVQFPPVPAGDYRRLFRKAPAPIVIYDAEGILRFANEAAASLAEVEDPATIQGRPVAEFIAADASGDARQRMKRILEDRQPAEPAVIELETTTGGRRDVEVAGVPITYCGEPGGQAVLNDVTERRQREQRLQTERDQFTALFEAIPQPVVHVRFEGRNFVVQRVHVLLELVALLTEVTVSGFEAVHLGPQVLVPVFECVDPPL